MAGFKDKPKDIRKMNGSLGEQLVQKYGKQVTYKPQEMPHRMRYRVPFSSYVLNRLSMGGIQIPRMHQFYGPEGVFKSTSMYDLIGNAQRAREQFCVGELEEACEIVLLDSEFGANAAYMKRIGVDVDDPLLHIIDGYDHADEAIDIMVDILKTGKAMIVGIDSITSLQSSRVDQTPFGELIKLQGWDGAFVSRMFKKLSNANTGKTGIIFANQIRDQLNDRMERIQVSGGKGGYAPTGGWAPRFYPSLTIELMHVEEQRSETYVKLPSPTGWKERKVMEQWVISGRVEKTRFGGNDQQELFFRYNPMLARVDHEAELIDLSLLDGTLRPKDNKKTSWLEYKLPGQKKWTTLGNGRNTCRMELVKDRKLFDQFAEAVTARTMKLAAGEQ